MKHSIQQQRRAFWRPALTVLLTVVLVAPALLPGIALAADWPAPSRANGTAEPGNEPNITYDPQGFAHVVWFDGGGSPEWNINYTNNRTATGAWLPQRRISLGSNSDERRPVVAVSNDGHVHVVWERRKDQEIYYAESPDFGTTWTAPVNVSRGSGQSYEPSLAVDANNNVHVVWIDRRFNSSNDVTLVTSRVGGVWGGVIRVGFNDARGPEVTTTGSGASVQVHIVWQGRPFGADAQATYDIYYSVGTPNGAYTPERSISSDPGEWSLEPAITSNGANELYLIYDKQTDGRHRVHFLQSLDGGATWSGKVNLDNSGFEAVYPDIAYGNAAGGGQVHMAWHDKTPRSANGRKEVYYVTFFPSNDSFGASVELVSSTGSNSERAAMGANPASVNHGIAWQSFITGASRGVFVSARISRDPPITPTPTVPPLNATLRIDGDQRPIADPNLTIELLNVTGSPSEMRIAFDRLPTDSDPWEPFQASFSRDLPASESCARSVAVQLRNAAGVTSNVLRSTIEFDGDIQAEVIIRNPYYRDNSGDYTQVIPTIQDRGRDGASSGHASYSRNNQFYLQIVNQGECSKLTNVALTAFTSQTYTPTNNTFANQLPLPAMASDPNDYLKEGPREVNVQLTDERGNNATFSQTMIFDQTPPSFGSGEMRVDGESQNLLNTYVDLAFTGVSVSDNLYPGGMWGVWIANTLNPNLPDNDNTLDWRPVGVGEISGGNFTVQNWNILLGLDKSVTDRTIAGQTIQVRVRFLDGAGNPTSQAPLTAQVTLSQEFSPPSVYLPLFRK